MGNTGSTSSNRGLPGDLNLSRGDAPLLFHDTHGDNIQLLNNKTRARRHESFCKGICFSNRPIAINERVYVKFVETNTSWSGVLRFGFTNINPATVRGSDLPRYACPDLTNKPGNWAKALGERYTTSNILLHFSVNRAGDVYYGVNGEEKGLFFSGVATNLPLWAMLDIYGNTVGVEFSHANAEIEPPANAAQFDASPQPSEIDHFTFMSISDPPSTPTGLPVNYHAGIPLAPLHLHTLQGKNIRINTDRTIAVRLREEYCNAFVFTSRPVRCGETIVIQVLGIDRSYIGGLGFGLTACDPSKVDPNTLPDDSDLLLDRLEYWVVNKDVCRNPEVGDELSFYLTESGEVKYARNNQAPVTLMHVDRTLPLWAFFDVYGNIQKIKLIGTTMTPIQGRLARSQSFTNYTSSLPTTGGASSFNELGSAFANAALAVAMPPAGGSGPMSLPAHVLRSNSVPVTCISPVQESGDGLRFGLHPKSLPTTPLSPNIPQEDGASDCKVCWEQTINCVLYTCGHMCLCFDCATTIRNEKGLCPICRQIIQDVIKIYRS
ncbi:protein neuralized-like isoform X2 [Physella acuta]|uniref:protein neuralized-like isoform X2 n=1 Tax=Physella acuta TaxID=109671 RepID=UPI0027DDBC55|nr:protein neuralized-like isoform X2 [Physella acuta]